MIEIKIGQVQPSDGLVFSALSRFFAELATAAATSGVTVSGGAELAPLRIAPVDSPATGMPHAHEAFGGGNVGAASPSASSLSNALMNAASFGTAPGLGVAASEQNIDPAAAFGGAPLPNGALSTAGADPSLTALAAPMPISTGAASALAPLALPSANVAPTVAAQPQLGGPALDGEGLPWDARIHSSSKGINAGDKLWKAKRGVMPQTIAAVKAELRQALGAGNVATPGGPSTLSNLPPPATLPNAQPTPTPPPLQQTTPVTGASSNGKTFNDLLPRVMRIRAANQLSEDQLNGLAAEISSGNIKSVGMLAVQPALAGVFWARLDALGALQ